MAKTKIEWATHVWNPITGCTPVSEGCHNCYARRMSKRLAGRFGYPADEPFKVARHEDKLTEPLRWRKPRKVFVCSMGDLFHDDVEDWMLDEIFGVMLACRVFENMPDHQFMVLTKRPERMYTYLISRTPVETIRAWAQAAPVHPDDENLTFEDLVYSCCCHDWDENGRNSSGSEYKPWGYINGLWPLPNVWLGVSAENQQRADELIPILLQIPAAKRFVSVEPMLGPIKLAQWIPPRTPFTPDNAPGTWADFKWPDWVPQKVRGRIEDFWSASSLRGPKNWAENAIQNDSPPFGMKMVYEDRSGKRVVGKWVFAWNNMGRLIADNGEVYYPSIPRSHLFDTRRHYWHDLHWVICGGETGPGARPMHPEWVRSLRDQCVAAGVPFFFKSWGKWAITQESDDPECDLTKLQENEKVMKSGNGWVAMSDVGKKHAGSLLDGQEWREFPNE